MAAPGVRHIIIPSLPRGEWDRFPSSGLVTSFSDTAFVNTWGLGDKDKGMLEDDDEGGMDSWMCPASGSAAVRSPGWCRSTRISLCAMY